ncbi:hypothetical protein [Saccharopolyspora phatthalungensis]|uniref:Uncharacterized protein n=1 Tax=Saccharopolyspora phatthalungensis TaxID=664693 RepID=A0A840Q7X6_9PSEU|nr:hypothetical protein [Saccharopolyspora phatthalungensis]MBB5155960.1 hypothetical protein [Saccharopolyspora phatthalungensis]
MGPSSDRVGRVGVHGVALLVVGELGWKFREQNESDWGIDAIIEVFPVLPRVGHVEDRACNVARCRRRTAGVGADGVRMAAVIADRLPACGWPAARRSRSCIPNQPPVFGTISHVVHMCPEGEVSAV